MITRLEVDGFKSFAKFAIDLPAFVAIVGPNASGKSNVFDALSFLARAVTSPLAEALAGGRGEPGEQFRRRGDGSRVRHMRFAVELLIEPMVTDAFGTHEAVLHTRLRYELEIALRIDERDVPRPVVVEEKILPIVDKHDRIADAVSSGFASSHLLYGANRWKILATEELEDGRRVFSLKGARTRGGQGRNAYIPAARAASSVLSSITTAIEFPLLYAVRKEIESWRFLQLEPTALRQPSVVGSPQDHLDARGGNLAWVLELIHRANKATGAPGLTAIAGDLARVIKGFSAVEVLSNEARGQWEVNLRTRDEGEVSARVASDGTLRLLALLTALYEPEQPGVLCFEEPENGINPRRLTAMLAVLRDLVSDWHTDQAAEETGLAQLIMSSHSPLLPLRLQPAELLVVDNVSLIEKGHGPSRVTRARRILESDEQFSLSDMEGWAPLPAGTETLLPGLTPEDAHRLVDAQ